MSTALADTGSLTLPSNETVTQRIPLPTPYVGKHREEGGGIPAPVLVGWLRAARQGNELASPEAVA